MFYSVIRFIAAIILKFFFRIRVYGLENLQSHGKLILCSNHSNNWDPILIAIGIPRQINWMGKKELFENKFLASFLTKLNVFPVERSDIDISAVKNALRVLKDDKLLGIFPEGTRVKKFDLNNIKNGALLISIRSKSPILPVYIESNYKLFSKVNIYVGEILDYSKELAGKPTSEDYDRMSKDLLTKIYALNDKEDNT